MTTPPRKPNNILRGKENIPPSMSNLYPASSPSRQDVRGAVFNTYLLDIINAHPQARALSRAVSRVAMFYRVSTQNNVLGNETQRAVRAQRQEEAQVIRREVADTPAAIAVLGWRETRSLPLVHADLWVDGKGPSEQIAKYDHHKCGICHQVKSHPVSYLCGHSHCYVCIRLWLERRWTCPNCVKPMFRAPFRHFGEEAGLACDYPDWKDESVVTYDWSGLIFPEEPRVLVPASP
ncbi:hypothetical protein R3P38DRAFT_3177411 [Favolaschia claudopus]|uniref:RING-type domain-containing protein n=1 Tax=Favolaschia claudopus TaxID=2862362 RepID=A0AAW0D3P8_9AGAR